jgi:hypothetical protein
LLLVYIIDIPDNGISTIEFCEFVFFNKVFNAENVYAGDAPNEINKNGLPLFQVVRE